MRKFYFLFGFSLLTTLNLFAQPYFQWAGSIGSSGTELSARNNVVSDGLANVYVTCQFTGTADLDPSSGVSNATSGGVFNGAIVKTNEQGAFQWAISLLGSYSTVNGIAVDYTTNEIVVTGLFMGTINFNPLGTATNLTAGAQPELYVAKYNNFGILQWVKKIISNGSMIDPRLAVDDTGNCLLGVTAGTGTLDLTDVGGPSAVVFSNSGVLTVKLSNTGAEQWHYGFVPFSLAASIQAIDFNAAGEVWLGINFNGGLDANPGSGFDIHNSNGLNDILLVNLASNGDFNFAGQVGGAGEDQILALKVGNLGGVLFAGNFEQTVDFDWGTNTVNLTSSGGRDAFLAGITASGVFTGVLQWGGSGSEDISAIDYNSYDDIYFALNSTSPTIDLNPGLGNANFTQIGNNDMYIGSLAANGSYQFGFQYGSNLADAITGLTSDINNNVIVSGDFGGSFDADPGSGNAPLAGSDDIFISKLAICQNTTSTINATACGSYTSPSGQVWTASNTYTDTISNATGCDSIITINLTINSVTSLATTLTGVTITATNTSATYQWLDCNNGYALIPGATNQSYTATANGNYAVQLTQNGCIDTSACVAITTVGILENSFGSTVNMYPNPTQGSFTVNMGKDYDYLVVEISTVDGKLLNQQEFFKTNNLELSISNDPGIYFVSIRDNQNHRVVLRVVKE